MRTASTRNPITWLPTLFVACGCTLAFAACGSSQKPSGSASKTFAEGVRYSDCMRSHGVSNFPDPAPGGGFNVRALGSEANSPAFVSAQKDCASLEPGDAPPRITGAQLAQMAAKARCIRQHGFPNFPDPSLGPGGQGVPFTPPAGWNLAAPAVIRARKACARVGIPIPGSGDAWFGPVT